jgi:hypothetical protein
MLRRLVIENRQFEATREANVRTKRIIAGGSLLNVLQWVRPGIARFTIEGEGADIWFCEQTVLDLNTVHASAASGVTEE